MSARLRSKSEDMADMTLEPVVEQAHGHYSHRCHAMLPPAESASVVGPQSEGCPMWLYDGPHTTSPRAGLKSAGRLGLEGHVGIGGLSAPLRMFYIC